MYSRQPSRRQRRTRRCGIVRANDEEIDPFRQHGGETGIDDTPRHQFGDAADVFVDNDGNGRMDDLNRDKRVDSRDARVIMISAERDSARTAQAMEGGATAFLQKPFFIADVDRALHQALGLKPPGLADSEHRRPAGDAVFVD